GSASCAALVRHADPDMYLVALVAPRALRARMLVLIALDVELSRSAHKASDPMIQRIRLQWWRDVISDAVGGIPARQHDVAAPLAAMLRELPGVAPEALRMIDGYERELGGPMDTQAFRDWCDERFGGLLATLAVVVGQDDPDALRATGRAMGLAFAIRNAVAMASENRFLLPIAGRDRMTLTRGEMSDDIHRVLSALVKDDLARLKRCSGGVADALKPVLRLAWRAPAILQQAGDADFRFDTLRTARPGSGVIRLMIMRLIGRW
ncbi:MAG: squalene/phytoene synthase family protein, partial [Pseudomonadota bacterium]